MGAKHDGTVQDEPRDSASSNFGALLKHHRIAAGLSQEALAERARMSGNGIGALERGYRRSPQRETLALLAAALELDDEQRREFETAARAASLRSKGRPAGTPQRFLVASNLPRPAAAFVGREQELDDLRRAISEPHIVTVAGPGGIGKTRLCLELASQSAPAYPDGVWFVDLSGLNDPDFVIQTIANQLGVREFEGREIFRTLIGMLSRRRLLLILDNAEHLLAPVAEIAAAIRSSCPHVTVLVTSREPLHVAGEFVYRLPPMPTPPVISCVRDLSAHDTTRLFLDRARAAVSQLDVTDRDAQRIGSICRKLDGIPLAIELAAARTSLLTVAQLDDRLSERLPMLASRKAPHERHKTLRATIDWSFRLLTEAEKTAFAKLSVFAGGFTLEACEALVRDPTERSLDLLESLVEKSFVSIEHAEGIRRFHTLDLMREYAQEVLAQTGGTEGAAFDHALYYTELAARKALGADAGRWYLALDRETLNLHAALDWCAHNDPSRGAKAALDLAQYWRVRSNLTQARQRLRELLACGVAPDERIDLLCCAAAFANMQDDLTGSLALAADALGLADRRGDHLRVAVAQFRMAEAEHRSGRLDVAESLYREAEAAFATLGDARNEAVCLGNLGMIARQWGDYDTAKALLEDAYDRASALGEERIAGEFITALGWTNLYLKNVEASQHLFNLALDLKERQGDSYGACGARHGLATVALVADRLDDALELFVATANAAADLQLPNYVFRAFHGISAVRAHQGDFEAAARYLGLAERLFAESGRGLRDSIAYDIASNAIENALDAERLLSLLAAGGAMAADAAIDELDDLMQAG